MLGQYTPVPYGHSWHVLDPLESIDCLPYPSDARFFLSCTALGPVWLTCVPVRTSSIDILMGHVADRVSFAAAVSEWYILPRNSCGFTPLRGPLLEPRCRADPNPKHAVSTYDNETEAANEFVGSMVFTRLHDGVDIVWCLLRHQLLTIRLIGVVHEEDSWPKGLGQTIYMCVSKNQ